MIIDDNFCSDQTLNEAEEQLNRLSRIRGDKKTVSDAERRKKSSLVSLEKYQRSPHQLNSGNNQSHRVVVVGGIKMEQRERVRERERERE